MIKCQWLIVAWWNDTWWNACTPFRRIDHSQRLTHVRICSDPRNSGERGHGLEFHPFPFKKEAEVPFHNSIIDNFCVYKIDLKKFIANMRVPRKWRMVFENFCYYFWGQRCWWTKTNILSNEFLFFISLHCPQLFHCPPAPASLSVPPVVAHITRTKWKTKVFWRSLCAFSILM